MEWIFIVVIWIILGIVCQNLAISKGRDGGLGCICGFLFGVFALLYYLSVSPLKKE